MFGCACDPPAINIEKCSCIKVKPILDDTCRYSVSKIRNHDADWYNAIAGGSEWEILSSDMDKEEPDAAHIIALALNSKNKVAFVNGHLEILRTLKALCNPDPKTLAIPFDRVQAAMIKSFGSAVKDKSYYSAFQLLVTSGGNKSELERVVHMGGLFHRRISADDQNRIIYCFGRLPA